MLEDELENVLEDMLKAVLEATAHKSNEELLIG